MSISRETNSSAPASMQPLPDRAEFLLGLQDEAKLNGDSHFNKTLRRILESSDIGLVEAWAAADAESVARGEVSRLLPWRVSTSSEG